MRHGDVDHCLARCGVAFVVLTVPSVSTQPAEGPFDDPTFRQHHEPFDLCWSQHGLQQPPEGVFDTLGQVVSAVGAVSEDYLQPMKPFFEPADKFAISVPASSWS